MPYLSTTGPHGHSELEAELGPIQGEPMQAEHILLIGQAHGLQHHPFGFVLGVLVFLSL